MNSSVSRRQTLGGLSASQLNSRGAQRVENVKKRASVAGVVGQNGTTPGRKTPGGSRRTSIFGWSQQSKLDPRPLTDKQYLNECVKTLIKYLTTHGYDNPVSPKTLTTPTSKDFVHIVTFLFRKVDTSLKIVGKMEEEVPQIFKKLKYPFPISRSALYAVGSPHSWPSLLAALTWLTELLNYEEKASEIRENAQDSFECDTSTRDFFDFVGKSYKCFLAGDDGECLHLEQGLELSFREKDREMIEEVERHEREIAGFKGEIGELTAAPTPLEVLQQKKSDLESDISKFQSLITKLKEHKETVEEKAKDKEEELHAKMDDLKRLQAENEDLEEVVSNQSINKEDVQRMAQQRSKLQDILHSLTSQKDSLLDAALEDEANFEKKVEELESTTRLYHVTADRLQLIPSTAKHAEGVNFQIKLNERSEKAEEIFNVDMKNKLKPALAELRESFLKKTRAVTEEMADLQEKLDASEEKLSEKQEEIAFLENQNKGLEERTQQLKESTDAEISSKNAEIEKMKADVQNLKENAVSALSESEANAQALRTEYEELCVSTTLETEMVNKELAAALEALIGHKLHIQQTLKKIDEQTKNYVEDVLASS
jgi:kinetochore protein NDC80